MRRVPNLMLALVVSGLALAATGRRAAAEPVPPDLPRLANVPILVYRDANNDGRYGLIDYVGGTTTDAWGAWTFAGSFQQPRLVVVVVGALGSGIRIGGDLQFLTTTSFAPYNGVPVKRFWDTDGPDGLFQLGLDLRDPSEDQVTRVLGPGSGGDYRFPSRVYSEDSAIVLAVPSSQSYRGLSGWLWDATFDDD